MCIKKFILTVLCCCTMLLSIGTLHAAPTDQKYCALLKQIYPGMKIRDVFLLLGPPHTFGQPPELDLSKMYDKSTTVMPPQAKLGDAATEREMMLQIIDNDPIMQAFINAKPNDSNVLIWQYESNSLSISVHIKGSTVIDVKSNFSC